MHEPRIEITRPTLSQFESLSICASTVSCNIENVWTKKWLKPCRRLNRNMNDLCRLRLPEQIKHAIFAQTLTELLHTNSKFEQITGVSFKQGLRFSKHNNMKVRGNLKPIFNRIYQPVIPTTILYFQIAKSINLIKIQVKAESARGFYFLIASSSNLRTHRFVEMN